MSDNNPQIFRDYVDADVETKMKIEVSGLLSCGERLLRSHIIASRA